MRKSCQSLGTTRSSLGRIPYPFLVTLDGTDDTVETARTYGTDAAHVVEISTIYPKPSNGPYEEIHTLELLTFLSANSSFYGDYDGTTTPIRNGAASTFDFTINFCGTNAPVAGSVLRTLHLADPQTVGIFLNGQNFTTCGTIKFDISRHSLSHLNPLPW